MINLKHAVGKSLTLMAVLVLCACTFSVPQFDAAVNFAKTITARESSAEEGAPAVWLASVGERGAPLNPYTASGLIVFANTDGDAIAFDGWTVRSVFGFGLSTPISISGKDGLRNFAGSLGTYATTCDPWVLEGLVWTQSCGNGDGVIELNEAGNIERIILSLGKERGNVTLRVAK
jgi:hypothetical protein